MDDEQKYRPLQRAPNGCMVHTCLFDVDEEAAAKGKFLFCRQHWSSIEPWRRRKLKSLYREDWVKWYTAVRWIVQWLVLRDQPLWLYDEQTDFHYAPSCGIPEGDPFQ